MPALPKQNPIRRNARVGPVVLPAAGRPGDPPTWPLTPNPRLLARIELLEEAVAELEDAELETGKLSRTQLTKLTRTRERLRVAEVEARMIVEAETNLWAQVWNTPQAVEWERLRWVHDVALYVRWMAAAQCGDLDAGKESRQYADRLGLTPRGMKSLMWSVAAPDAGQHEATQQHAATGTDGGGPVQRRHLVALDGGGSTTLSGAAAAAETTPKPPTRKRPTKKTTTKPTATKKSTPKKPAAKRAAAKKTTPRKR
ncbi:hypothetical protein [Nocardioides sp.]|uniref:hypothetical protein n=1 Tax=Nocardioides sp. TaxID=35761 RepID=UPI00356A28B4